MAKLLGAFRCTSCNWWNYPLLREYHHGNYDIVCGNCGHRHHRYLNLGKITEDRHYGSSMVKTIQVLKSQCQEEERELGKIAQFRNMVLTDLTTGEPEHV